MKNLRVVYMGTPDFAVPCLERLVSEGYQIAAVVTQPDRPKGRGRKLTPSPVKETALKHNLPVWQPEKVKTPEFVAQLEALNPDVIIVVAFGQLLSPQILVIPEYGCINVHASLLPKYRGAAPIHWAVINGETETGVATMYMDAGLDTGDVILERTVSIDPEETTGQLYERLRLIGADLLVQTLGKVATKTVTRTPQDNNRATYAKLLTRDIEGINWRYSAQQIHNLIRGLNPWPGAYCEHSGKILKIWRSKVSRSSGSFGQCGQVLSISETGCQIATSDGIIELLEVQPESKKRMTAGEYVRGYGMNVGEILG